MTDEHALLAAIAAGPEDDTARLAYADFVEENGDADRAEFIRVQVELEQIGTNTPARARLVRLNRRFHATHVHHWRAAMPQLPGITWGDYKRGLIEEVQARDEAAIVRHAAAIFAEPAIHIIRLAHLSPRAVEPFAALPQLRRVRSLRFISARAQSQTLQTLFGSPHLDNLAVLDLHGNSAGDAGVEALASAPWPALVELWLGSNGITTAGARALAASPNLPRLNFLDLRGNDIADLAARAALVRRFGPGIKL